MTTKENTKAEAEAAWSAVWDAMNASYVLRTDEARKRLADAEQALAEALECFTLGQRRRFWRLVRDRAQFDRDWDQYDWARDEITAAEQAMRARYGHGVKVARCLRRLDEAVEEHQEYWRRRNAARAAAAAQSARAAAD